jgi:hypothetical protein
MKENVWKGDRSHKQPSCLWRNLGGGKFADAASTSRDFGKLRACARGSAAADFDGDGRLDVALAAISGGSRVLRNTTSASGHAVEILPVAGADRRTALGTKVRVTADGSVQTQEFIVVPSYASGSWLPLHFGLGDSATIAKIEVILPGATEPTATFRNVAADRPYVLRDGQLVAGRAFRR